MADTGFLSSATEAQDAGGTSPPFIWTSLSNVRTSDNTYCSATITTTGLTKGLYCTNFGAGIPAGSTIDGIEVLIEKKTSTGRKVDSIVSLYMGGVVSGDNKSLAGNYPTVDTQFTYGSPTDLWGLALTDTDVNDSGFGVAFKAQNNLGLGSITLDYIALKIYYTEPPATGFPGSLYRTIYRCRRGRR